MAEKPTICPFKRRCPYKVNYVSGGGTSLYDSNKLYCEKPPNRKCPETEVSSNG